jgi:hypothetical protein
LAPRLAGAGVGQASRGEVEALAGRLAERREEIEQTIIARVHSLGDPSGAADPEYALGLKAAVCAGVSYGLAAIEEPRTAEAPIPDELLAQARRAARSGVGLDTVLRRYIAAHALLDDFIVQEAEATGMGRGSVQGAVRVEAALLDRLVDVVAGEYRGEVESRWHSRHRHRMECVEKLLAGEPVDASALDYDLTAWHLAAVAMGEGAGERLRGLAKELDRRLLFVPGVGGVAWAWLGGAHRLEADQLERLERLLACEPTEICLVTGEPAQGLSGWRLSHRQARAALPVALRVRRPHVRYADVALLASMLQDEVLLRSLTDLYLAPLSAESDGGEASRRTLRAYFSTGRNASSTASLLGVGRKTVATRLRKIETRLGRPLERCAAELEATLDLHAIGELTSTTSPEG